MIESILNAGFEELGISADKEACERFQIYSDYLTEINQVMNLTAIEGEDNIARLHFLDCTALLHYADFQNKSVIDVGTGAGFPGLPLKIACPSIRLTLLDSLDKRINFLKNTCEKLNLEDVTCIHARAEEAPASYRASFDFAVSRAVARLNLLCELCLPLVRKNGCFISMKSTAYAEELKDAERCIRLLGGKVEAVHTYHVPGTDVDHSIIVIRKVADTPAKYPRRWAQIKSSPL